MSNYTSKKNRIKILKKRDKDERRVFTASSTFPLMKKLSDLEYQLKVNMHGVERSIQTMSRRLRLLENSIARTEVDISELKGDLERIVSKAVKKELSHLRCRRM